mmetsp:Transcript_10601/g.27257  ORF Transcript_10601/g.27257 Transcript_10601/m.27257 type:complete len:114 (+) Transcript_10601:705-1046(+)
MAAEMVWARCPHPDGYTVAVPTHSLDRRHTLTRDGDDVGATVAADCVVMGMPRALVSTAAAVVPPVVDDNGVMVGILDGAALGRAVGGGTHIETRGGSCDGGDWRDVDVGETG